MSHRQRRCLTLEPLTAPSVPVHKVAQELPVAPRPPHAVWLWSLLTKTEKLQPDCLWGVVPRTWEYPTAGPTPWQSLCQLLHSTGDLMPCLQCCAHALLCVVFPSTETRPTKSLLYNSVPALFSFLLALLRNRTFSAYIMLQSCTTTAELMNQYYVVFNMRDMQFSMRDKNTLLYLFSTIPCF